MYNQANSQFFPGDRRKTRSIEVTPEDIHYLEIDYIEAYQSRKKKNILSSNIKNDSNLLTIEKETNREADQKHRIDHTFTNIKNSDAFETKEEIIKKVVFDPLHACNILIPIQAKNENEFNTSESERNEEKNQQTAKIKEGKQQKKKSEGQKAKKHIIFGVEIALKEDEKISEENKKASSRKKGKSNGDREVKIDKIEFKIPNGVKEEDKKVKSNAMNKNVNELSTKSKQKENISAKNASITSHQKLQDPITVERLSLSSTQDLHKIFNEFMRIKYLGKKRFSSHKLTQEELKRSMDEAYAKKIEFKCNKETSLESPTNLKELLKFNLNNPHYNQFLQKLDTLKSIITEDPKEENRMFFNNIPNFYDDIIRREDTSINFIKVFQEDYAPIQLQKDNEKFFEKMKNEENWKTQSDTISIAGTTNSEKTQSTAVCKTHFIKKKQSALNIKRRCGVSYVVHSESKQLNVEDKYGRLGHLVYQGTHSIDQLQDEIIINHIDNIIISDLLNTPVVAVAFESPDEIEMKDYLLFPEKRMNIAKEIFILESIDEIWKFSKDKFFFAINLLFDENKGIRNFTLDEMGKYSKLELLAMSNIHLGILFRKATSGIKSVLKLYKAGGIDKIKHSSSFKLCNLNEEDPIDKSIEEFSGLNMTTLSMRIELFVPEIQWKCSGQFTKEYLFTFISRLEEKISSLILNWNEYRYTMYLLAKDGKVREYIHACPYYTLNTSNDCTVIKEIFEKCNENKFEMNLHYLNDLKEADKIKEIKTDLAKSELLSSSKIKVHNSFADKLSLIQNLTFNSLPSPMYVISTRDCFVFDLVVKSEILEIEGRKIIKKEFFFDEKNVPANFFKFQCEKNKLRVGVVTYENYYTNDELEELEKCVERTEEYSLKDAFLPETAQKTFSGDKIKRTKFFFGSRYMWTKRQLSEPNSYAAAGIRKDVSPPPFWMKEKVEAPLVNAGIILKDFVNSFALNVYHDGSEGLGQHFDDAVRFKQPIYTLRLFSDCRLSFGSQLYGFCNGAFTIPLPRGCICVMEENSYASNGVKHCIRPCDMAGKSSALILRQMHPNMIREAEKYDYYIDFPSWFSSLSVNPNSVPYTQQKAIESDMLIKLNEIDKKKITITREKPDCNEEIVDVVSSLINSVEYYIDSYVPSIVSSLSKKKKKALGNSDY